MRSSASLRRQARSILLRHCEQEGLSMSVMPGVHLMRFGWTSVPLVATQSPCMAMVIQGSKSIEFADTNLEYGAGQYLLASIDMPATSRIANASKTHPLLALAVQIDFAELKAVIQRCDTLPRLPAQSGISVFEADVELLETIVRLLRLLDTPEHVRPLAPLIRQEILYRLLSGPAGSRLLEICRNGSPSNRVSEAAVWIQKHFAEGFLVAELAHHVGMSPSSLHQHFKAITGMTPVQYQKRIRLQAARRSLLIEAIDIGEASFRVGYQSHSQFSKDYRHYFGRLPKDDIIAHSPNGLSIEAYTPEPSDRR
jgi:AraC-like DNA-binding protein